MEIFLPLEGISIKRLLKTTQTLLQISLGNISYNKLSFFQQLNAKPIL
jgi:hypothetical protein